MAGAVVALPATADAAPIAAGNLVILRTGTGVGAPTSAATAVFLDEYTPAGTLVQSIAVPSSGSGALTLSGNQFFEGILSRSQNGSLITFAGYRKNAGGTNPNADAPGTTNRVIGTLTPSGTINTALAISDATGVASGAATADGSTFYLTGATLGVRYVGASSGTVSSTILNGRSSRQALLNGNHLIVSNVASITPKIDDYGTLPTAAVVSPSPLVVIESAQVHSFVMLDLNPAVAGDDTLYLLNLGANEVRKYTKSGTSWSLSGSIASGLAINLAGVVDGTDVDLYLTSANGLFALTDTSGYGGTLTGSLGSAIATPGANRNFRGAAVFMPEPSGVMMLIGLAGALALRRRRR